MSKTDSTNRPFQVVLFDLGSTLIYFDAKWPEIMPVANRQMVETLLDLGYRLDSERFCADFERNMQDYYIERDTEFIEYTTDYILHNLLEENGYRDPPPEHTRLALDSLYKITQTHWKVEADARPAIEDLHACGYRMGLVSNAGDAKDALTLFDKTRLRAFFEVAIISAEVGVRKPAPRIFELALKQMNVPPQQAVMVGDTLGADILGARNAGLSSVWITRRADSPDNRAHEDTIQPDATITALSELPALLKNWPKKS
ncbi:MAG: HAD family hydrolase [Anaerolineaceae bacterium]|nr:HAD family hydrolase [Anaerolineaceae bacterium]